VWDVLAAAISALGSVAAVLAARPRRGGAGVEDGRAGHFVTMQSERRPIRQISGAERERLSAEMARLYEGGADIRAIAVATGRGYGTTRRMLLEAGVALRSRGGARRRG